MPSTFNLGTCTAIISHILESLSLALLVPSGPAPYNHAYPSHIDHSQRARGCQDLWIPVMSPGFIPIPNFASYHSDIRGGGKTQSIRMVHITHHSATGVVGPNA
ncbi:hypothetical protein K503DRAFT_770371 [Rhizopogon vinicolor AM-OR11-026]|uniref:Uncharacterized protein n=1 Tax=Rhizopogon vinicolor AM-OR11-026 TaxID=1314800 RepID=A0A1B7N103_9AGAM|nr:hypothetical protein K503DRAFT_770371 [Rhizopogon vinicolor AM-OR11-026]